MFSFLKRKKKKEVDKRFRFMEVNEFTKKIYDEIILGIVGYSELHGGDPKVDYKINLNYMEGTYEDSDFYDYMDPFDLEEGFTDEFNEEFRKWAREFIDGSNSNMTIMDEYSDLLFKSIESEDLDILIDNLGMYCEEEGFREIDLYLGISTWSEFAGHEGVFLKAVWK